MSLIVDTPIVYTALAWTQCPGVPGGDIRERFGDAVRDRREALGLTQEEFAERAGIHRTYLSDIERGTRNVSLVNIERLSEALALEMSDLFKSIESG